MFQSLKRSYENTRAGASERRKKKNFHEGIKLNRENFYPRIIPGFSSGHLSYSRRRRARERPFRSPLVRRRALIIRIRSGNTGVVMKRLGR